eukprot:2958740-Rhodomonas_salina.4
MQNALSAYVRARPCPILANARSAIGLSERFALCDARYLRYRPTRQAPPPSPTTGLFAHYAMPRYRPRRPLCNTRYRPILQLCNVEYVQLIGAAPR